MTCFHPITVWANNEARLDIPPKDYYALKKVNFHKGGNRTKIEIPCGHCLGCRLDHANMWATRLMCEKENWKNAIFLTLTYNNENLPLNKNGKPTLCKRHLQQFLKRLRYYFKGEENWKNPLTGEIENPIRYYACGEYGTKSHRPHYHLIIFNLKVRDLKPYSTNGNGDTIFLSKEIAEIWGKGFITIGNVTAESVLYTTRYVQKKAGLEPQHYEQTGECRFEERTDERNGELYQHTIWTRKKQKYEIEPEFNTMSRAVGLGRKYWIENKNKIIRNNGVFIQQNGHSKLKPIPKYFKKLWETENYEEYYRWRYQQQQKGEKRKLEILSRYIMPDGTTKEQIWEMHLKNAEISLKQRICKAKRTTV